MISAGRAPFTSVQWAELEHQALIFKYMMAGVNVPPELLNPIRKSVASLINGMTASHHAANMRWGTMHRGVANNTDPEPGRCRRTDGKKWRCGRDVVPDQKYCERHVHRGRNRSRKHAADGGGQAGGASTSSGGNTTTATTTSSTSSGGGGGGGSSGITNLDGVNLKKGPWTSAEDAILVSYVSKHGEGNWNAVQKHSGLFRCGKSCRLRWANHLRPNLKKGAFSPDEERTILDLHSKFGNKWARMAAQLPGRTDNEIKNYWNTRIKRRLRAGLPAYPLDMTKHVSSSLSSHVTTTTTTTQDLEEKSPNLHPLIYLHGYNGHNNFKGSSCLHMKKQRRKLDVCTMMIVDKIDGVGDFTTVQAAVHAVPDWSSVRTTIHIHEGIYKEKVHVPSSKTYVTFQGSGRHNTIITWDDNANKTGSTFTSASVAVHADHFIAQDISFENTAPKPGPGITGAQAIAFEASGDMAAFYSCAFYGAQDTLYDRKGRHFFKDCYIEGSIDFIFGNGRSLYKDCMINTTATKHGYITAHSRQSVDENTGFSFVHCSIVGTGLNLLGRAWGPASRVVFSTTFMDNIIDPLGWSDWGKSGADMTIYYGEYCNMGPGANTDGRTSFGKVLTFCEAMPFMHIDYIDGWEWLE
ncbi:unnamed protein product [Sphagnum troendelagicum]|uniref:Pectinesterase n=1 Tax=Sphagnum troendelagicum TaxID=128251 RepID=A0ABP0UF98_9BRYO